MQEFQEKINKWQLFETKNSKFYSMCFEIETVEDCEVLVHLCKKNFKKCTHICYGYVIKNLGIEKFSDDGEPSGTAGKPILEILKKNNLQSNMTIVIRFFGGVKLGAGPLLRSYVKSAALANKKYKDEHCENINSFKKN